MAGAKPWNVDRQKGGSYEFSLDASGNYVLNSVGFNQVKTLNLPKLKKEPAAATTTTPKDTKTASAQTKEAFGDVQPFYYHPKKGGGDSNEQYINEYKIKKDKSLDTEPTGAWDRGQWGPKPDDTSGAWDQGQWGPQPSKGMPKDDPTGWAKVAESYTLAGQKDKDELNKVYKNIDDAELLPGVSKKDAESVQKAQIDRFGSGQWGPKPSKGMPVDTRYRSESEKFKTRFDPTKIKAAPQKAKVSNTALRAVKTTSNVLSKAFNTTFKPPLMGVLDAVFGNDIIQQGYNQRNKEAFSAVGYKTRGELGSNIDPGRIAGNHANNVFAGMNMVSARGDVMQGARNRISTRKSAKTQARISKLSPERQKAFNDKTKEFERQTQEVQATKNKQDLAKGGIAPGASGGSGNSGGNTRVICTELHSTGEMSTKDWLRDIKFTYKDLSKEHIKGYLLWAVPTVEHIKKYPTYRKIWKHLAQHRANDIAWRLNQGKFDLLGRIYAGIGEPLCWLIGKCVSDKQIKELELSNWRKA